MPNGVAPTGDKYKIGAKGGRVGQAWQYVWDRLDHEDFHDAKKIAEQAAKSADIKIVSIMSHIHRMAAEGLLETKVAYSDVMVTKGGKTYPARRKRTHIRIPKENQQLAA